MKPFGDLGNETRFKISQSGHSEKGKEERVTN
jgi:hypothetical protein